MLGLGLKLYEIVFLLERNDVERILITQRYHYRPYNIRKIRNLIISTGGMMVRHPVPSHYCLYQIKLDPKKRLIFPLSKTGKVTIKRVKELRQLAIWSRKRKGCYAPKKKKKKLTYEETLAKKEARRRVRFGQKRALKPKSNKLYGFKLKGLCRNLYVWKMREKQDSRLDQNIDYKKYLNQPRYKISLVTQYRKFYAKKECQYIEMIKSRVPIFTAPETKVLTYLKNGLYYRAIRKKKWKGQKITKWEKYWFNWRVMLTVPNVNTFFPIKKPANRYNVNTRRISRLIRKQRVKLLERSSSLRRKVHFLRKSIEVKSKLRIRSVRFKTTKKKKKKGSKYRPRDKRDAYLLKGLNLRTKLGRALLRFLSRRLRKKSFRQVPTTGHKCKAYVKKIFLRKTTTKTYKMVYTHPIKKFQIPSQFRKLPEWWLRPNVRYWFKWGIRGLWIPLKLRFARYKRNFIKKLKKKRKWRSFKARQSSLGHNESLHIPQFKRKIIWKKYPYQPLMTLRYWGNGKLSQRVNSEIQIDVKRKAISQGFILSIY